MSESVDMLKIYGQASPAALVHELLAELSRRGVLQFESVRRQGRRMRVVMDFDAGER